MFSGPKLSRRHALLAGAAAPLVALSARPAVAKADMMGMATPGFSRFKHGDFEVTTLLAGTRPAGSERKRPRGIGFFRAPW